MSKIDITNLLIAIDKDKTEMTSKVDKKEDESDNYDVSNLNIDKVITHQPHKNK